jgi:hypothetical protein
MPYFSAMNALTCIDSCQLPCETIRYVISEIKFFDYNPIHNMGKTEHIIGLSSLQYPMFTEKPGWTFYTFVAGMGGMMAIFMHLDFVFFIEWFFVIAKWLITTCWSMKKLKINEILQKMRYQSRRSSNVVATNFNEIFVL